MILKRGENIKYRPFAFTEHGILMLSSVLNSRRAVKVNIRIMRAFIRLREIAAGLPAGVYVLKAIRDGKSSVKRLLLRK